MFSLTRKLNTLNLYTNPCTTTYNNFIKKISFIIILGLAIYLTYGIHHSKLNNNADEYSIIKRTPSSNAPS